MKVNELFAKNSFNKQKNNIEIQLDKNLSRAEALRLAPWKKSYGDCRGFSYNSKTGKAIWL